MQLESGARRIIQLALLQIEVEMWRDTLCANTEGAV